MNGQKNHGMILKNIIGMRQPETFQLMTLAIVVVTVKTFHVADIRKEVIL
jgi:hypothetical protein